MNDFTPDNCPFTEGIDTCKLMECSKNIMGMCTKRGSKNYPDVPHRTNFERIKLMSVEEMAEFLSQEAYIIWFSEQPLETMRAFNDTQIKAIKGCYYRHYLTELQSEVEE